ncbi:DUF22 domain-containing protein [Methanolobus psychrotolerans]|uniref:DUF22 domain-containing protein n=1 Tax=Methanolobus psychrotolerans TaxID=1874706 RepID=UPI000B9157AD|nr:DUF22 domain-containing protein [Methanolobus psychrotolerans]
MKKEVIQVVSRNNGELVSKRVEAAPYEFTIATRAKWEMVIADEDMDIRAGEFKKINVKDIQLDPDMVAIPCTFSHHALVSLIKVGAKGGARPVDSERIINAAYVLGQETGKVNEGDLLAVLNVFPIMFTREALTPQTFK